MGCLQHLDKTGMNCRENHYRSICALDVFITPKEFKPLYQDIFALDLLLGSQFNSSSFLGKDLQLVILSQKRQLHHHPPLDQPPLLHPHQNNLHLVQSRTVNFMTLVVVVNFITSCFLRNFFSLTFLDLIVMII